MKRDLLTPFVLAALGLTFLFVCAMVVLSRSHPAWVQRKLRIGAVLLGLTAVTTGSACGTTTCYAPIVPDAPVVDPTNVYVLEGEVVGSTLSIDLTVTDTLLVEVSYRVGDAFSYRLEERALQPIEIERNDLEPVDGTFDEPVEEFEIVLPTTLATGTYYLRLFSTTAAMQPYTAGPPFELEITNE